MKRLNTRNALKRVDTGRQRGKFSERSNQLGESAVTAAPFFERAERPSKPFWGLQQGNKLVLWESLSGGVLEKDGLYGARPIRAKEQRGTGVPGTLPPHLHG
jgi:hypothetical protein